MTSQLMLPVVWGVAQATCAGLVACLIVRAATRLAPTHRARISLAALLMLPVFPLLMLLPLDSTATAIRSGTIGLRRAPGMPAADGPVGDNQRSTTAADPAIPAATAERAIGDGDSDDLAQHWWKSIDRAGMWLQVSADRSLPAAPSTARHDPHVELSSRWLGLGLWAAIAATGFGIFRLILGLVQIRRLVSGSHSFSDAGLSRLLDELTRQLQVSSRPDCRIASELTTPAVVGWRSPVMLLPSDWRRWSSGQLRAAVAHELAHIRRRDPLWNSVAQAALSLSYFHPLAHWLIGQLRLDQELAADGLAAPLAGGRQSYLEALAGLALRHADGYSGGPALAFLPSRRTFVRRIEMLRYVRLQSSRRASAVAAVAGAGLFVAAATIAMVRPGLAQPPGDAPQPRKPADAVSTTTELRPLNSYVPDLLTAAFAEVDVQAVLNAPAFAGLLQQIPQLQRVIPLPGHPVPAESIERVILIVPTSMEKRQAMLLVRFTTTAQVPQDEHPQFTKLDDRTLLISDPDNPLRHTVAMTKSSSPGQLVDKAERHPEAAIRAAWRTAPLKGQLRLPPTAMGFSPLWQDVASGSAGLKLEETLRIQLILDTLDPPLVADTLIALRTMTRNALQGFAQQGAAGPTGSAANDPQIAAFSAMLYAVAKPTLDSLEIDAGDNQVTVSAEIADSTTAMVAMLLPAIQASREAARRVQRSNNLKQIMLALHNYHDAHGHLPPSVIEENGVKRSWRVEILPFLEQHALYDLYDKTKPWDSPANERVVSAVVPVYATPGEEASTMTPIRANAGPQGLLTLQDGEPIRFGDVLDGLSNTIAIVEVKDTVHWAEPDQYAPTPEQLIGARLNPDYLLVGIADGSVKTLSPTIALDTLQALLTRAGNEVVGNF